MQGLWLWMALCFLCPTVVHGGKVLVFPIDGSHWVNMKVIIEALHSRGHQVSVVRSSDSWYIEEKSPFYNSITLDSPSEFDESFITTFVARLLEIQREGKSFWTRYKLEIEHAEKTREMFEKTSEFAKMLLENKDLMQSIKNTNYDLVLTDPVAPVGAILANYLKLPLVFNARWTSHGTDYISLFQAADLWLMRVDFVFEYPRPTMPNVVYIGGFQCKPAKPLPEHLEEFVQSSGEHGVIVMSLGTFIAELPQDLADQIAAAFAKMPQKVIWRYKGAKPATLGNNTLLVDWMPQIDLLGHPKTKLFVAHGGTNGVQEALMNMQRLSRLHRDAPMKPMDSALFWIEFVMRHKGAAHLRTESYRLPWYSYHSVDVMLFLAGITLLIFMTFAALV
ncbi:UDP-glucuronosyltransferase 2A1 [Takifugu flavidus]|uniref:UDP-glucuronosyltransferase 2A1 n=1 Tax=Takifugu flavidus TaxID=433684 RepID=A0A5C6NPB0_9TELE|nr:UDP-glucuronosyltransferase 2A1 [Takifugu flavidus]